MRTELETRTIIIELTAEDELEIDRAIDDGLATMITHSVGLSARTSDDLDTFGTDPCWDLEARPYEN